VGAEDLAHRAFADLPCDLVLPEFFEGHPKTAEW
jgi:hypothetical protein